ncbi:hypothetical protein B0H13DRAFT_2369297 [Mycena leptocephala]|nr:hypothetical protein B0H13DRAFT_2369297 [Mycena leptocephala]
MPINMLSRGNILVCRAAIILEDECPGLQAYITEAYLSVATLAAAFVADEEDTVAIEVLHISPPSSSAVSASTAASSSSAPAVAGPSRLSPPPVAGPSRLTSFQARPYEGIDAEIEYLKELDREIYEDVTHTLSATPLQAATFFMSDNSPPHTSDSSPPDTSDSSPPDTSVDDGDPELAKRSDEITKYLRDVCYPQIAQWEASKGDKDKRTRKDYIEQTIYPDIDEKFDISGPNGFKIQDFQDTIVQSFKNWIRVGRNKGQLPDPARAVHDTDEPAVLVHSGPAPRICRKTAKDMFRKENKEEIGRVAKAENKGARREVRDGLELTMFGRLLEERWAACSETEKERLEEKARAHNEGLKTTTEETLAKNQEYLNNHVYDALQRLIGFGPKQAGKCCFFVRTACVQPDGTIKFRRVLIYEGKTKADFKPLDDGEVIAFKDWATSKLSTGGDLPEMSLDMDDLLMLPPEEPLALDTELKVTAPPAAAHAHAKTADENEENTEDFSPGLVKAVASTAAEANAASSSSTPPNAPSAPPLDAQAPSGDLREASMDINILFGDDDLLSLPPGSIVLDNDELGIDGGEGGLTPPMPPTPPITGEGGLTLPPPPTPPVTGAEGGLAPSPPPTPPVTGKGGLAPPPPPTPPVTGAEGGLAPSPPPTPPGTGEGGLAPPPPPTPVTDEGGPVSSDAPVLPPAAARKRGRPPRAVPPAVAVDNEDTPCAPAPKKRGRPPKKASGAVEKGKAPAKKASGAAAKRKAPDTGADAAPMANKRQRVVVIPEGGIRCSTREGRGENNVPRLNL